MASTFTGMSSPRRMMAPLPKFFSIWASAVSSAFFLSSGLTGPVDTGADFFFSAIVIHL